MNSLSGIYSVLLVVAYCLA